MHTRLLNVGGYEFDITTVYRDRTPATRRDLWANVTDATRWSSTRDWIMGGDVNKICIPSERDDSGSFNQASANEFILTVSHLFELETYGGSFT